MDVERELERMTSYVRGMITGLEGDFDVIDRRELDAARKQPLATFLRELEIEGLKLRGALGNRVEDVLDLFEAVRTQSEISKSALAQRSGISRGHIGELLRGGSGRPTLDTAIRLAVALDYPLEVVEAEVREDDIRPPKRRRRPASSASAEEKMPASVPREEPEPSNTLFWMVVSNGLALVGGVLLGGVLKNRKPSKKKGDR